DQPVSEIVLQPEQNAAVADRRVIIGIELVGVGTAGLQHAAELGRVRRGTAAERIDDEAPSAGLQPDQETAREIEADHLPALRAGGMQIKDAERYRHATAALDHPHEIGVLQVVIG